jgi:hypothetical protein
MHTISTRMSLDLTTPTTVRRVCIGDAINGTTLRSNDALLSSPAQTGMHDRPTSACRASSHVHDQPAFTRHVTLCHFRTCIIRVKNMNPFTMANEEHGLLAEALEASQGSFVLVDDAAYASGLAELLSPS